MKKPSHKSALKREPPRPVSFVVRVWHSPDDELHGTATSVKTGQQIPFSDAHALVEILRTDSDGHPQENENEA